MIHLCPASATPRDFWTDLASEPLGKEQTRLEPESPGLRAPGPRQSDVAGEIETRGYGRLSGGRLLEAGLLLQWGGRVHACFPA